MNESTIAQIQEHCLMVMRGKPCSMLPIMKKDFKLAKILITTSDCKFKGMPLDNNWLTVWIYINDVIPQVIDMLPSDPETAADHYLLGALFGYSNEAICDYINKTDTTKYRIELKGKEYPLHSPVFNLIHTISSERDDYKLISCN